jgi:hypothetical protein
MHEYSELFIRVEKKDLTGKYNQKRAIYCIFETDKL